MSQKHTPSAQYRRNLIWAIEHFSSHEEEAALFDGALLNMQIMDDLEAAVTLVMGYEARVLAPPKYRPSQRAVRPVQTTVWKRWMLCK